MPALRCDQAILALPRLQVARAPFAFLPSCIFTSAESCQGPSSQRSPQHRFPPPKKPETPISRLKPKVFSHLLSLTSHACSRIHPKSLKINHLRSRNAEPIFFRTFCNFSLKGSPKRCFLFIRYLQYHMRAHCNSSSECGK